MTVTVWNTPTKRTNKYGNKKTRFNGHEFDSKKEADFAWQLEMQRKARDPAQRVEEVVYQPSFRITVNGEKICTYRADFSVRYADGREEVIDVKSAPTAKKATYRLKKKLMWAVHGIEIREV